MKLNFLSEIELSRKDKEKGLRLPNQLTEDLAYLCGVLMGDGHLRFNSDKGDYYIKCVGHPIDEKEFYDDILKPLFQKIFNIEIDTRMHDSNTTYGFMICSKALTKYFCMLGIPSGKKSSKIQIPDIIRKSDMFTLAFIKGLADTDFCLTLKKRYQDIPYYPVIVGVSKSKKIIDEISRFLLKFGFKPSVDTRNCYDKRLGFSVTTHALQLYGHEQLIRWMNQISFMSPKHLKKYEIWKNRKNNHSWERIRKMKG